MRSPEIPRNERQRLQALHDGDLLRSCNEARLGCFTRMIARFLEAPICLISLVAGERVFFKSKVGLEDDELPRDISICGHTILQSGFFEIPDTFEDNRFFDNPLVTGEPFVRFYAGMPLRSPDGHNIGTVCVMDRQPRRLNDDQRTTLIDVTHCLERELFQSELKAKEASLQMARKVEEIIVEAQKEFIRQSSVDRHKAFDGFLKNLLTLTESEYGFIGEVLRDEAGAPYLKAFALTNISWNEDTSRFYDANAASGLEFHNLDSLFGVTLRTGEPVIANEPATDPRGCGIPPGHPPLNTYLGVPVHYDGELVAMFGMANRANGYNEDLLEMLRPITVTFGQLIIADRVRRQMLADQQELSRFKKTLDRTMDAVFIFDRDSLRFIYVNDGAVQQLGYSREELCQMHPYDVKPNYSAEKFRSLVSPLVSRMTDSISFETTHRDKAGNVFPVEVLLQLVADGGLERFVAIVRNIEERNKIDEALRRERDMNIAMLNTANAMVLVMDKEGRVSRINRLAEKVTGYRSDEIKGIRFWDTLTDEAARKIYRDEFKRITEGGLIGRFKCHWPMRSGSRRLYDWSSAALVDASGEVQLVISVGIDISKQEKAEKALIDARDAAQRANQAKSEFLASMSHELRTPLNAIIGFAQILEMDLGRTSDMEQETALKQIAEGGHYLLALIDQILDLARVESGRASLEIGAVPVHSLVSEVIATTKPLADKRNITVVTEIDEVSDVRVLADPMRLKQILLNLMSNGVKYNRMAGRLAVKLLVEQDMIRIGISDTGYGISEEAHRQLFTPFARLGAEKSKIEGSGLGLTITKQLVELMNGRIWCESVENRGSTFWVEIPEAMDPPAETKNKSEGNWMANEFALPQLGRPIRLVYMEDNRANQILMTSVVARLPDCQLEIYDTAEEGLENIFSNPPDLVLTDINMPGKDGYEALRLLRGRPETSAIPVIAVSASAMPLEVQKGRDEGFFTYITKPIVVNDVIQAIKGALSVN